MYQLNLSRSQIRGLERIVAHYLTELSYRLEQTRVEKELYAKNFIWCREDGVDGSKWLALWKARRETCLHLGAYLDTDSDTHDAILEAIWEANRDDD